MKRSLKFAVAVRTVLAVCLAMFLSVTDAVPSGLSGIAGITGLSEMPGISKKPELAVKKVYAAVAKETAVITSNEISLGTPVYTDGYGVHSEVSEISDFFDPNGVYTIAYANEKKVFISHINDQLEIADTITVKKPMPLIGGVCCDKEGNFYIVCGQEDKKEVPGSKVTLAVYKYSPSGKLLGKCEDDYRRRRYDENGDIVLEEEEYDADMATRIPFHSGNCSMAFRGSLLICSYAKEMYDGHQANAVFCVDTATMKETADYDSYTSHSFNQSVLVTSGVASNAKEGTVVFADHGDAYPRGMSITIMQEPSLRGADDNVVTIDWDGNILQNPEITKAVPFHFYGEPGDNVTNARLTGIGELDTGIVLVGSSAKSMTKAAEKEEQQLFLQILDAATGESLLSASSRKGTSKGVSQKDTGILWLTDGEPGRIGGSLAMAVIDTDKVLVMWQEFDEERNFINSYYSIIRSDGKILKKAIPMQNADINGIEELKYQDGYVMWTHANTLQANTAVIYRMNINETTKDNFQNADIRLMTGITYDENLVYQDYMDYTGNAVKPKVLVTYGGKELKKNKDYAVSYSNNKKIGIGRVKVTGKGKYQGTVVKEFQIAPQQVKNLSGKYSGGKIKLSWNNSTGAEGYEILFIDDEYADTSALEYGELVKTVLRRTTKTSYSEKLSRSKKCTYYVRPYATVKGKRIYGQWTGPILTAKLK